MEAKMPVQSDERPLDGIRVIEFSSLAPGPFSAMVLADFGADVILLERPGGNRAGIEIKGPAMFSRGKRSIVIDLKDAEQLETVLELLDDADVVIEGYRPGVMERLGLGPDVLQARNPRLIYARATGWGQHGAYAQRAGHDINYIAIGGPLGQIGTDRPTPPGSFVGDFASGGLMMVIGVLLALQARARSGLGQVVDAAMVDGSNLLMAAPLELVRQGLLQPRGQNMLDGNAPYYGTYETSDGRWYSVGSIEPVFYDRLLTVLGLHDEPREAQNDRSRWPALCARFAEVFRTRTSAEWDKELAAVDACGAPVLEIEDLMTDPHLVSRESFRLKGGIPDPMPAPRLSRTPGRPGELPEPGAHSDEVLNGHPW
jgi:alpha-methylacyl-CoA racemase